MALLARDATRSDDHALLSSFEDAERAVMDWMRRVGHADARLTPTGADGGIDVESSSAVAQVKWVNRPVGRPQIQQLKGVARQRNKRPLFFALTGYSRDARAWADEASVALFRFDQRGVVTGENRLASELAPPPNVSFLRRLSAKTSPRNSQAGRTDRRRPLVRRRGRGGAPRRRPTSPRLPESGTGFSGVSSEANRVPRDVHVPHSRLGLA